MTFFFTRSPLHVARSWGDALDTVRTLCPAAVVADVEPLIAHWSSAEAELVRGIRRLRSELAAVPSVRAVALVSNSRRILPPGLVLEQGWTYRSRARKPWALGGLSSLPRPICVVGDQILTDGLLALRLGAPFVHVPQPVEPWWPRWQSRAGRLVARLAFRAATKPSEAEVVINR
jgi:predicted HAD superfamily phosphohydrolase YqeG